MKIKKNLLLGVTASLAFLLTLMSVASAYSLEWEGKINETLGIEGSSTSDEGDTDTQYFKSEFGDGTISEANQALLVAESKKQCYNEVAEGATLLRNRHNALPLAQTERKISIFGNNATNFVYLPSGGGEGNSVSADNSANFKACFDEAGFQVNPTLWNAYVNSGVKRAYSGTNASEDDIGEVPLSFYTDQIKSSFDEYSDAAIIVITRESGEGADMFMNYRDGKSKLALTDNERDMINMVTSSGKFSKTIVLINTTNQLELDWVEEYNIDSVLWVGSVGQWGALAIPDLLTGKVNPSGRTVDTWAANSLSAPACVNAGTNTPQYLNVDEIGQSIKDSVNTYAYMQTQVESIYVGYRYYETRYEDVILNQGNANSTKGAIQGSTNWDYAKEMCYPFGHGLSYSTFSETLESVTEDSETDTLKVTVKVKNTGTTAGKHSVLVYAQTPYGTYEKEHKVEKSAIQLVQYGKTKLLEPNEEETLELKVDKYLLASYDQYEAKTYIRSAGNYYLALGNNIHDALNNILAKKGASNLVDEEANPVTGDTSLVYEWAETFDKEKYSVTDYTGAKVTNVFEECDLNHFFDTPVVTYLSRSDWDATYPVSQTRVAATTEMIRLLKGDLYKTPADAPKFTDLKIGVNKGIKMIQLKDKEYDDPMREEYLAQYSLDDLAAITAEASGTKPIADFGVPHLGFVDGPMGVCSKMQFGSVKCTTFPSVPILTAAYNKDLLKRRGELMGEEAVFAKKHVVNGPGCNLHRTPFNGRTCIYYSEDANLTYLAVEAENAGMLSKGVTTAVKHFVGNDQEFMRTGVSVFFEEQGMREIAMRAFESSLNSTDNTLGSMMSFNRLGCVSDNNASYAKKLTRNEWGFHGFYQTDAAQHYSSYFVTELDSGTDIFSTDTTGRGGVAIAKYIKDNNDGYLYNELKETVHHIHYMMCKGHAMNGLSSTAKIVISTPWWQVAELSVIIALGVLTLGGAALLALNEFKAIKGAKVEG
ncbi:MAG: glycoside hydrolase family 3 C-terminal domain-containing protein [Bacilli bacterium]|nr:glycoside hydrolase family 3 C-terminal domain-containing protein [Bacilli bacterium]